MSRKTIMTVLGFISAILVFLKVQFELAIDPVGFIAAIGVVLMYVLFQGKMDIQKIGRQVSKFKSKKFWLALIAVLVPAINTAFGLNIPVEMVMTALVFIMTVIFGKEFVESNKIIR